MSRFRRKKGSRRGGGGGGAGSSSSWGGFVAFIMGTVSFLIALITFGIVLSNYDTAYTTASTYGWMVGLTSIMGVWPMVLLIVFMVAGLGGIGGGAYLNWKRGSSGSWNDIFMVFVMGAVSCVIAIIMFGIIETQLNTTAVAINATTNIASFTGLYSMITIWPMVVFVIMMAGAVSSIIAAGMGGWKQIKGRA